MDTNRHLKPEVRLENLKQLMINHDKYYAYSDDHRVWTKGTKEAEAIRMECYWLRHYGWSDEVTKLYEKYYRK